MTKANEILVPLFVTEKELTNGETGEKFTKTLFDGYVTVKGSPVYRVRGQRLKPETKINKTTKQEFIVNQAALSFYNGEDTEDLELKEEFTLFIRLDERETRADKSKFIVANTASLYFGKGDPRNTKGLKVGNLKVPMNGIIETRVTENQFGDKSHRLVLSADNKYSIGAITTDMMADDDKKVGYTPMVPGELFTDEELAILKEQFKYFNKFDKAFNGELATASTTKVTPADF